MASGLWNLNEARLGCASRTHKALHEQFDSDVVRIGPNESVIRNVDVIDKFYSRKYGRGTFHQVFSVSGEHNIATMRDNDIHGAWKRIW